MTQPNALLAEALTLNLDDQTKTPVGFTREVPPAGKTTARFVGYIEMGKRKQRDYQGKPRKPEFEVMVVFEFNSKKHRRVIDSDEGEKEFTNVHYETMAIKLGDKGSFKKLFNKMKNGRDSIKHMAQMLGEGFIITVVHNQGKGEKADVTYANIRDGDGSWLVAPPQVEDAVTGEVTDVPIPEATVPMRLLIWNSPTKLQWDSLFIEGSYTRKKKGSEEEEEVSKNWMQTKIVTGAVDFEGSALEALLLANGGINFDLTGEEDQNEDVLVAGEDDVIDDTPPTSENPADGLDEPEKPAEKAPATPEKSPPADAKPTPDKTAPAKEKAAAPAPKQSAEDVLAALGL